MGIEILNLFGYFKSGRNIEFYFTCKSPRKFIFTSWRKCHRNFNFCHTFRLESKFNISSFPKVFAELYILNCLDWDAEFKI